MGVSLGADLALAPHYATNFARHLTFTSPVRVLWDALSASREVSMVDQAALAEIERRIQVVEDNLRQLVEQAAAYSGAADEERNADRIAEQQAKLDALLKEREALLK
jgi:predicted RNA-binding protein